MFDLTLQSEWPLYYLIVIRAFGICWMNQKGKDCLKVKLWAFVKNHFTVCYNSMKFLEKKAKSKCKRTF